ncbi:hypothetical protein AB0M43_10965 [Longispora sp. NPDC051575]|uniref:hypothetical protein n=1 Tax=Longispora sp. NPDC051575 TaxID=3154943 RepID=UPI00342DFF11
MNAFEDLNSTDSTLDAIGRGERPATDDLLFLALTEWRADAAEPGPAGGTLIALRPAPPRRRRLLVAVAAGLVLVAGAGGVTAAAGDARPGSVLWPVTRLAYGDRAESFLAEQAADRSLTTADRDLAAGRVEDARRHLAEAEAELGKVGSEEAARRLAGRLTALRARLGADEPSADPTLPLVVPSGAPPGGGGAATDKPGDKRKPTPPPQHGGGKSEHSKPPGTPPSTHRQG